MKKHIPKYDSIGIDITANVLTKQKKKKKEKSLVHNANIRNSVCNNNESSSNHLPGNILIIFKAILIEKCYETLLESILPRIRYYSLGSWRC